MVLATQSKDKCPLCSSAVEEYLINLETKMTMCENVKCTYPFNTTDPTQFVVKSANSTNALLKGKKREKAIDQTQKSVNGKKQETTYSLTSPIEQKDKPFVLALPSKSISTGSVVASPSQKRNSSPLLYDQELALPKRLRTTSPDSGTSQAMAPLKTSGTPVTNTTSSTTTNNYSLADIELLLNDTDEDNGSTVVTPKEVSGTMNSMLWLDDIFEGQNHSDLGTKCDPLQTNQDLDSLLGLSLFQ